MLSPLLKDRGCPRVILTHLGVETLVVHPLGSDNILRPNGELQHPRMATSPNLSVHLEWRPKSATMRPPWQEEGDAVVVRCYQC